jgi:hypothetical protein
MSTLPEHTFWLVWNEQGYPPRFRHDTKHAALTEAERLARANPGSVFFVLEAIEARTVDDMRRIKLEVDDDIPF